MHCMLIIVCLFQIVSTKLSLIHRRIQNEQVLKFTHSLIENKMYEKLVDFDNHLDNLQLDWVNPGINQALPDQQTS